MGRDIYLDHAAATPLDPRVLTEMHPYFSKQFANPSSLHAAGRDAGEAVEKSRKRVAAVLHCKPEEIIFTSGGTESINLALKGIAPQQGKGHIITSAIEHPAVLETCRYLESVGFTITSIPVDRYGLITPRAIEKAIRKDTILISIMYANNEIGTLQPITEIGKIAQRHQIPFHTDACQAGMQDLNVEHLNADLLSLSGSKIYGPKDCGILYQRKDLRLTPLLHGGGQEFGFRSGTENVPGIVGFAEALKLTQRTRLAENKRLQRWRDHLIARILMKIPETTLNGHPTKRLSNNAHISFAGIDAEQLLEYLSQEKIYVSTGSACSSNKIGISPVLTAIGLPEEKARSCLRFTLGKSTTKSELDRLVSVLHKVVPALRKI